jgi:UDP:flavonoid glycosyltransferase YjiC (YdhE family)
MQRLIIHSAGVPQIVLPVWIDTYDFATRVEYLQIGVWGSRNAAPRVEAEELGIALVKVIDSDSSAAMAAKAKAIAPTKREGREVATEKIIELLNA